MRPISKPRKQRSSPSRTGSSQIRPRLQLGKWMLLFVYSAAVIYWMFLGFGRTVRTEGPLKYNLELLRTVKLYFNLDNGVSVTGRLINLVGNVAVFIPFGVLFPLLLRKFRSLFILTLWEVPSILLLEIFQMLLRVGSFDVDDLLLNLIGVWLGYLLLRINKHI
ncbi:VanZ family protein [Paenibacillus auburnensis]|nr:VanZ family protein [Paenibacillus auburnensis]